MTINDLGGGGIGNHGKKFEGPSPGKKISKAILREKISSKNKPHKRPVKKKKSKNFVIGYKEKWKKRHLELEKKILERPLWGKKITEATTRKEKSFPTPPRSLMLDPFT